MVGHQRSNTGPQLTCSGSSQIAGSNGAREQSHQLLRARSSGTAAAEALPIELWVPSRNRNEGSIMESQHSNHGHNQQSEHKGKRRSTSPHTHPPCQSISNPTRNICLLPSNPSTAASLAPSPRLSRCIHPHVCLMGT